MRPHHLIKRNAKSKQRKQKTQHQRMRRQEYEEEKDPVASIDVANFIQQPDPDNEAIEDPMQFKNRQRDPKYDDDIESLINIEMSLQNTHQNLQESLDDLNGSYKQTGQELPYSDKHVNNEFSDDIHKQNLSPKTKAGEKLSRRNAIPFFSHKSKEKKHKKRRLFNFGMKKTSSTTSIPSLMAKFDSLKPGYKNQLVKVKRSSLERFCPLCKKQVIKNSNEKGSHNSRQYFQRKQKQEVPGYKKHNIRLKEKREKRESKKYNKIDVPDNLNNDTFTHKLINELDEVQKKLDALEIKFPERLMEKIKTQKNNINPTQMTLF
ncbi:hypothetical protein O0L34_g13675 [Tuta absoluta]|nr:hypothetical protein O0L34_g13675 [Tuta absoluta]